MKITEILLNHIRNHPGCISSDIYEALKHVEERKNLSSLLSDLTKRNIVYREEWINDNSRKMFKYWIAGADAAVVVKEIVRTREEQSKARSEEKEAEKQVKEQYIVIADGTPVGEHKTMDKAVKYAKGYCETVNNGSVSIAKVVKTFKRVVTIVEE